ncbi:MAG: HD domain-containing protein [Thermoplasmatota archaeon]
MNLHLPSRIEAWQRLRQAAPPDWVLDHVRAVEGLAIAMTQQATRQGIPVHEGLVSRGALLHDIGRSITQDLRHAYLGADMLRTDGASEVLARVVECHTGAGLEPPEAAAAGLPARDYMPRSWEERIVAHADNLYSGAKRLDLEQVQRKYEAKALPEAWKRIEALHAELASALDCDLDALQPARMPNLP